MKLLSGVATPSRSIASPPQNATARAISTSSDLRSSATDSRVSFPLMKCIWPAPICGHRDYKAKASFLTITPAFPTRMEDAFPVRLLLSSAPGSGTALRQGLRASSRRSHRPTGAILYTELISPNISSRPRRSIPSNSCAPRVYFLSKKK